MENGNKIGQINATGLAVVSAISRVEGAKKLFEGKNGTPSPDDNLPTVRNYQEALDGVRRLIESNPTALLEIDRISGRTRTQENGSNGTEMVISREISIVPSNQG